MAANKDVVVTMQYYPYLEAETEMDFRNCWTIFIQSRKLYSKETR